LYWEIDSYDSKNNMTLLVFRVTRRRLKRDCPFLDHHVSLYRQTSNGIHFILFLEDDPILIPYDYINFTYKISKYETYIKQLVVYFKFETKV